MFYIARTPGWVKRVFSGSTWEIANTQKSIFLTFDDGPHPVITPMVLDLLAKYRAKATFFCIGKNVMQYPDVYARILKEGHAVGNHSYDHVNGWKTSTEDYTANVLKAAECIHSRLFRPPYGKITRPQRKKLTGLHHPFHIVMWSVLSGDFDLDKSPDDCLRAVTNHAGNGSVIVFHDSDKAKERLLYALPEVLDYFSSKGFSFEKIVL